MRQHILAFLTRFREQMSCRDDTMCAPSLSQRPRDLVHSPPPQFPRPRETRLPGEGGESKESAQRRVDPGNEPNQGDPGGQFFPQHVSLACLRVVSLQWVTIPGSPDALLLRTPGGGRGRFTGADLGPPPWRGSRGSPVTQVRGDWVRPRHRGTTGTATNEVIHTSAGILFGRR